MHGMDYRQQEFLAFVLDHYVQRGIGELDTDKLPHLIELKYNTVTERSPSWDRSKISAKCSSVFSAICIEQVKFTDNDIGVTKEHSTKSHSMSLSICNPPVRSFRELAENFLIPKPFEEEMQS